MLWWLLGLIVWAVVSLVAGIGFGIWMRSAKGEDAAPPTQTTATSTGYWVIFEEGYQKGRADTLAELGAKRSAAGKRAWATRRGQA